MQNENITSNNSTVQPLGQYAVQVAQSNTQSIQMLFEHTCEKKPQA